jgi:hypothetical protein
MSIIESFILHRFLKRKIEKEEIIIDNDDINDHLAIVLDEI